MSDKEEYCVINVIENDSESKSYSESDEEDARGYSSEDPYYEGDDIADQTK